MIETPVSVLETLRHDLKELERRTLCLAADTKFRRVDDEHHELITVLCPTPQQRLQAAANLKRLEQWTAAVTSVLRRRGNAQNVRVARLSSELAELVQLNRCDVADTREGPWRNAFEEEVRNITLQLEEILQESVDAFAVCERRPARAYENLDISIRQIDETSWKVKASASNGEEAEEIVLPTITAIEEQTARHVARRLLATELGPTIEFGRLLFDSIFTQSVRRLYERARGGAADRVNGLRFSLDTGGGGALAGAPWELLYDGQRFLGLDPNTSVTRATAAAAAPAAMAAEPEPLRVLVTISAPKRLPLLDVDHEKKQLQDALAPLVSLGHVHVDVAGDGSMNTLRRRLRSADDDRRPYHVWHFIGHGRSGVDGGLAMEDERREPYYAGRVDLHAMFSIHRSLRLAVLNACEGARGDDRDWATSTATAFVDCGVSSVVAMQFKISDVSAIKFAEEFYGALVDRGSIDAAMAEARRAIYFLPNYAEWFIPVLVQRGSGRLFEGRSGRAES